MVHFEDITVLYFKTNTSLEVAAIRASFIIGQFVEVEKFHRYYFLPHVFPKLRLKRIFQQ